MFHASPEGKHCCYKNRLERGCFERRISGFHVADM